MILRVPAPVLNKLPAYFAGEYLISGISKSKKVRSFKIFKLIFFVQKNSIFFLYIIRFFLKNVPTSCVSHILVCEMEQAKLRSFFYDTLNFPETGLDSIVCHLNIFVKLRIFRQDLSE